MLKGRILGQGGAGELRLCATESISETFTGIAKPVVRYRFTAILDKHNRTSTVGHARMP